jgi:hypothetical protein
MMIKSNIRQNGDIQGTKHRKYQVLKNTADKADKNPKEKYLSIIIPI